MHPFLSAAIGGALIGFSVVLLMFLSGRIGGISGIVGGLLPAAETPRYGTQGAIPELCIVR
jgi:uncharacterized protein